jgi:hypothetical protein
MSGEAAHAPTSLLLADYARGRLDAEGRAGVAAHLEVCAECREMLETYALLEAASARTGADATEAGSPAAGDAVMDAHLTSAVIAALAVAGPEASPTTDETRHLGACHACAEDLRAARAANATGIRAARPDATMPVSVTRWILPLAAVLAIAFLGVATVREWRRSESLSGRIATLETDNAALRSQVGDLSNVVAENRGASSRTAPPDDGGPVPYLLLRETVRGAPTGKDRITLPPGGASIYLALALDLPATVRRAGEGGRVLLRDGSGREIWRVDLPGGDVDRLLAHGDALLLKIPAAVLHAGPHEIRLTSGAASTGARVWFRSSFEVSGKDPSR